MKMYIGKVKENAKEGFEKIAGMDLLVLDVYENNENFCLAYPTNLDDFEKYFKIMFEDWGKEWINEDYKYFLEYILNPDCELISSINKEYLEDLRELTKEDDNKICKALCEFKIKHKLNIERFQ